MLLSHRKMPYNKISIVIDLFKRFVDPVKDKHQIIQKKKKKKELEKYIN